MRELLLEHGTSESAYERLRWNERCAADAGEPAWLRNFQVSVVPRQCSHVQLVSSSHGASGS